MASNVVEPGDDLSGSMKMFLAVMLVFAIFAVISSFTR